MPVMLFPAGALISAPADINRVFALKTTETYMLNAMPKLILGVLRWIFSRFENFRRGILYMLVGH